MNLYGLKYGISMMLEELLNKEVIVSMPDKIIKLKEFLPEYERYGRSAPLKRNLQIIDYADEVIAFWDGMSHGTRFVIENCKRKNVPIKVYALANK